MLASANTMQVLSGNSALRMLLDANPNCQKDQKEKSQIVSKYTVSKSLHLASSRLLMFAPAMYEMLNKISI